MFIPAHDAVVFYALETGTITESADGVTPAALPATPSDRQLLGYTNLPQTARGLNNSKGFALGLQGAAYNKRGRIEPTATVEIRPGSLDALDVLLPDANGVLPYIALFVAVKGQYTDGVCECGKTNHFASDVAQSPEGDLFVLTECALFRFDPAAPSVTEALSGYPSQSLIPLLLSEGAHAEPGHPGGNCLRFPN